MLPIKVVQFSVLVVVSAGFSLSADANPTYTTFDPPGSSGTYAQTLGNARTDHQAVIGFYDSSSNQADGFVRTR